MLVFVDKQEHADSLMQRLISFGYPCVALHGGVDQTDRDSHLDDFKKGNVNLLVSEIDID